MYDLHILGWKSFQQLCQTIASEILGQTFESFLDSNDGGKDGAFKGNWNPTGKEDLKGRFVIQCKFTCKKDHNLSTSDLKDELGKIKKLVEQDLCDIYVLMTNAGVSGCRDSEIKTLLYGTGIKHVLLFGSTWIYQQIRENKRLRMLVPRVYGLGDLSQIIDERVYTQSRTILESLREDLSKVVVTSAYHKAALALNKHNFVLLVGEPAAGKTTIAALLAMVALDNWNAPMLKLDEPKKVAEHWNPEEPSQFFWVDDAFGVTQYESSLVHDWNHIIPLIKTMLRKGAKIVMTSRDYIYNRARNELKGSAFPLLQESQVVIDVHDLSLAEKQQILYNHIKLGKQPIQFRKQAKPYLEAVAAHESFIPEIARRLADPLFTKELYIDESHLCKFVEEREKFLQEVLKGLDYHSRAALALIYMRNGRIESPITIDSSEKEALSRLRSNLGECITALESLNGSLVFYYHDNCNTYWSFKHPTISDAYASILIQNPELLGIYLQGCPIEKMMGQITCGNIGIDKAIVIPKKLFPMVLSRLCDFKTSDNYSWRDDDKLLYFLAKRCSKEFLEIYLENDVDLLNKVSQPGLYLYAVSEVDIAIRLHQFGLFPEDNRKRFVETVCEYAIKGEDLFALENNEIKSVFNESELNELSQNIRTQLIPNLGNVRIELELNHRSNVSADEHMEQLLESFYTLEKYFSEESNLVKKIKQEIDNVNEWVAQNMKEEIKREPRIIGNLETSYETHGCRSIFDDIDS